MFSDTFKHRVIFTFIFVLFFLVFGILLFIPVFNSNEIIIPYINPPFDICEKFPILWKNLKLIYPIFSILAAPIYSNFFYKILFRKKKPSITLNSYNKPIDKDICLYIGKTNDNLPIYLSKESLYQNILITGTIGTGKTSSAMYPFTKQLIRYQCQTSDLKLGMLILDVKGNYYEKVLEFAKKYGRLDDIIVIELKRESKI